MTQLLVEVCFLNLFNEISSGINIIKPKIFKIVFVGISANYKLPRLKNVIFFQSVCLLLGRALQNNDDKAWYYGMLLMELSFRKNYSFFSHNSEFY